MLIIGVRYFWLVWHLCVMKHASHIASHSSSLHKIPVSLHVHSTLVSQTVPHVACS